MTYKRAQWNGPQGELYSRNDVANILNALEIASPRSGFEHGWQEALRRVALAFALEHKPDTTQPAYWLDAKREVTL